MNKHTPGLLVVAETRHDYDQVIRTEKGNDPLALVVHAGYQRAEGRANAEHLVACWNACEGINPEAVPELLKVVKYAIRLYGASDNTNPDLEPFRAVIIKAEAKS